MRECGSGAREALEQRYRLVFGEIPPVSLAKPGLDPLEVYAIDGPVEVRNLPEPACATVPNAFANQVDVEDIQRRIVGFVEVLADERLKQLQGVAIRVDDPMHVSRRMIGAILSCPIHISWNMLR